MSRLQEVPDMVTLELLEDDATWVASKISVAVVALGAESLELENCLLCFGCASEEILEVIKYLVDWLANYFLPLGSIHILDSL